MFVLHVGHTWFFGQSTLRREYMKKTPTHTTDYIARQTIHFKRQHVLEVTTTKTSATLRERKTIYCALQESHTWIEFLLFCYLPYKKIFDVPV